MKLTKREILLIGVLGAVVLLWGYYNFIISPQHNKLKDARETFQNYRGDIGSLQKKLDNSKEIDSKVKEARNDIEKISKKYFVDLKQEETIIILNELLQASNINIDSINFSQFTDREIGSIILRIKSVDIPFRGEYEQLTEFMENVRTYEKSIGIKSLRVTNDNGLLSGNIILDFYSLPGELFKKKGFLQWNEDINKERENPFEPFKGYRIQSLEDTSTYYSYNEYLGQVSSMKVNDNISDIEIVFGDSKVEIEDFEDESIYVNDSKNSVKTSKNKDSIRGRYSLKIDHNLGQGGGNSFKVSLGNNILNEVPKSLGLWIYSVQSSEDSLLLNYTDINGSSNSLSIIDNIDWSGWKYHTLMLPKDKGLYPISIDNIELVGSSSGDKSILLDSLEANYTTEIIN